MLIDKIICSIIVYLSFYSLLVNSMGTSYVHNDRMDRKEKRIILFAEDGCLTQEMISISNTIYVIKYDFDLQGQKISIPKNSVLLFDGGSFKNGVLIGNDTNIEEYGTKIFDLSLILDGTFNIPYLDIRWFGAIPDFNMETKMGTDVSPFILKALEYTNKHTGMAIRIIGNYYMETPIVTPAFVHLIGESYHSHHTMSILNNPNFGANENSPSYIYIKSGITAFTFQGTGSIDATMPKAMSFTFKNITFASSQCNNGFGIEHLNYDNSHESILVTHTATGNPSRYGIVEECLFRGFDKCFNFIPSEVHYQWGTFICNFMITSCHFYKDNGYAIWIDGKTTVNTRIDSVTNLAINNCGIYANVHLYDLYGANCFKNCIFEGRMNQIDCNLADGVLVFEQCYFEYQKLECTNCFKSENGRATFSFEGCYNTPNNVNTYFEFEKCTISDYDFNVIPQAILKGQIYIKAKKDLSTAYWGKYTETIRLNEMSTKSYSQSNIIFLGTDVRGNVYGKKIEYKEFRGIYNGISCRNRIVKLYKYHGDLFIRNGKKIIDLPLGEGYYMVVIPMEETNTSLIEMKGNTFVSNMAIEEIYEKNNRIYSYCYLPDIAESRNFSEFPIPTRNNYSIYNLATNNYQFWGDNKWLNMDGSLYSTSIIATKIDNLCSVREGFVIKIVDLIDLDGKVIELPTNCTLIFDGGKIINGVLKFNKTKVLPQGSCIEKYITAQIVGDYESGQILFDSKLNKLKVWYDNSWFYLKASPLNIKTVGTFVEKPIASDNVGIGFEYFCLDRNTKEGGNNGILIYHIGNNVWVDALGRVIN